MPTPVQIWMPFMERSPLDPAYARDLKRAFEAWSDIDRVWMLPNASKPLRWVLDLHGVTVSECMLRSELLNAFTVFQVDEARHVYPHLRVAQGAQKELPEGLYREWLNAKPDLIAAPREFTWLMPHVEGNKLDYRYAKIPMAPAPIMPFTGVTEDDGIVHAGWPPPGQAMPKPVSPETESASHYGRLQRIHAAGQDAALDIVVPEHEPQMHAIPVWLRWPDPFHEMFPTGAGIDLLHHQALMRNCIEDVAAGQHEQTMRVIEHWTSTLTGQAEVQLGKAWLLPKLYANPEAALFEVEGKYGIAVDTVDELMSSQTFREMMDKRVPVRRVQSWLGYFWWELWQDATARITVRLCSKCGQVIRKGHRDRQFCTREENAKCFRQRNSEAQRRVRSSQRSQASG